MKQGKRILFLSIDLHIRVRGTAFQIGLVRLLKWLAAIVVIGIRLYVAMQHPTSPHIGRFWLI